MLLCSLSNGKFWKPCKIAEEGESLFRKCNVEHDLTQNRDWGGLSQKAKIYLYSFLYNISLQNLRSVNISS